MSNQKYEILTVMHRRRVYDARKQQSRGKVPSASPFAQKIAENTPRSVTPAKKCWNKLAAVS
jgi:hypothetical protein